MGDRRTADRTRSCRRPGRRRQDRPRGRGRGTGAGPGPARAAAGGDPGCGEPRRPVVAGDDGRGDVLAQPVHAVLPRGVPDRGGRGGRPGPVHRRRPLDRCQGSAEHRAGAAVARPDPGGGAGAVALPVLHRLGGEGPHRLPRPRRPGRLPAARPARRADGDLGRLAVGAAAGRRTGPRRADVRRARGPGPGGRGPDRSGGRALPARRGRGDCVRTEEPADLRLDVGTLGSLYLGDASAVRLAALGAVTEERSGALALADAVFRTARRPWCPDIF